MNDRCCARCAYVGRVHNGDPDELICVNCPVALGEPVRVQLDGVCENFRAKPGASRLLVLPTPPNDRVRYIALTRNQFAIVDTADYPELSKYPWTVCGSPGRYYAIRRDKNRKTVYMHRQIMQPPPGMVTDHINGSRLDNRRENLRNCRQQENRWNSRGTGALSGFTGVWYDKDREQYEAVVRVNGEKLHLGWFDDPVEAAHVRDRKALEVYGPYAYLNLPDDLEPHPIPPDPNHPERPVRMTGPYGYLRCPPYLPPLPDGTWPAGPRIWGVQRVLRLVAWAQDHPAMPNNEGQTPEPQRQETSQAPSTTKDTEDPARPSAATESTHTKARRHKE
jgi:hypothetical protein